MTAPANQPLPTPPAMPETLPDVALNPNAKVVLAKRNYRKGPDGQPYENARALFWQIGRAHV